MQQRRKRIRKLQDTKRRNDRRQTGEIWDRSRNDERNSPVNRDEGGPGEFSLRRRERREAQKLDADVIIHDLESDIPVQGSRDGGGGHGEGISGRLKRVRRDAQVAGIHGVLTLVTVHEEAVEHVPEVDERLGAPHGCEEVSWRFHLCHELGEYHCAAVGEDGLHGAADGAREAVLGREAAGCLHGGKHAWGDWFDEGPVGDRGAGGLFPGGVVGVGVCCCAHGDEHAEEVNPDGAVGDPAEFLECADLSEDEADERPD